VRAACPTPAQAQTPGCGLRPKRRPTRGTPGLAAFRAGKRVPGPLGDQPPALALCGGAGNHPGAGRWRQLWLRPAGPGHRHAAHRGWRDARGHARRMAARGQGLGV